MATCWLCFVLLCDRAQPHLVFVSPLQGCAAPRPADRLSPPCAAFPLRFLPLPYNCTHITRWYVGCLPQAEASRHICCSSGLISPHAVHRWVGLVLMVSAVERYALCSELCLLCHALPSGFVISPPTPTHVSNHNHTHTPHPTHVQTTYLAQSTPRCGRRAATATTS